MDNYFNQITDYLKTQSLQIAVLVVVIAAITLVLKNKSAHVRYLLWLVVLAKCLVPPFLTVPLAILPEPRVATVLPSTESITVKPVEIRMSEAPTPPAPVIVKNAPRLTLHQWLTIGWIAGIAIFVTMAVPKALRTEFWLRRERKSLPTGLQSEIKELFSSLSVRIWPKFWLVEGIGQPFVWGLLRGNIYLPANFIKVNSTEHRKGVLGHELSHVLRFDAVVNFLQIVAQAIFWFHPFVWWVNKRIRAEREKCCDEMVIARLNAQVRDYSKAIVDTLVNEYESTRPIPSLAIAGPVKNIEERIKTMLVPGKKFYKRPSLIAASTILLAALLTVPTALVLTARAQTEPVKAKADSPQTLHQAAAAGDIVQVQKLLAQGVDIHAKDKNGRTPLHAAAWHGRKDVAAVLLAHGANVNEVDGSGQTPLHLAANFGGKPVPELLLAHGAQIDARDKAGNTPLHAAADQGYVGRDLLEFLIAKGADVKARNEAGQTPLHRVSMIRKPNRPLERTAEVLLALGAEVDPKDKSGYTPLHFAVGNGHKELVDLLLAKGADVRTKAADGTNLLHQAAKSRQLDMVEWSLSRGIDVSSALSDGRTALHVAASAGENSIVEALIARGADVMARDVRGQTPVQFAVRSNRKDTVCLLLDKGAEVSTIQIAAYIGDLGAVKGFLERAGNVTAQDKYLTSTLWFAAQGGQKDVAAFLISKGASVNVEDIGRVRMGALHFAAVGGSKEVAELLIANGAEVNAKADGDATPLYYAAQSGAKDVAKLLIEKGDDTSLDTSDQDHLLFRACGQVDKDLAELVIRKGINVNSQAWGYAPAMEAMWSGYTKATKPADIPRLLGVLKVLLDHGADPDAKDRYDWSLLHYACGNVDLMKLLLDRGANPNVRTCGGRTPLHFVADEGNKAATQLLLSRGADVNAKDFDGYTPLSYAEDIDNDMWGHSRKTPLTSEAKAAKQEVARILRKHGAKE